MAIALFSSLLGERWSACARAVRALHGSEARVRAQGIAEVSGESGRLARAMRRLLGLPRPNASAKIDLAIVRNGTREVWRRRFDGGEEVTSSLCRSSRWPDAVDERLGPVCLTFALETAGSGLRWRVREARLLHLRLPRRWLRGVEASCGERDGRYVFDVAVRVPLVGLLIAYSGWLDVVADE